MASKEEFIKNMMPYAEVAARTIGVDPRHLIAQAALETGWGKSLGKGDTDSKGGIAGNNLFGIKAGKGWKGDVNHTMTREVLNGKEVRMKEPFRAYESPLESFMDFAKLIKESPKYKNVVESGANAAKYATELKSGGYATDPNYVDKLMGIIATVKGVPYTPSKMVPTQQAVAPVQQVAPAVAAPELSYPMPMVMRDHVGEAETRLAELNQLMIKNTTPTVIPDYVTEQVAQTPVSDPYEGLFMFGGGMNT